MTSRRRTRTSPQRPGWWPWALGVLGLLAVAAVGMLVWSRSHGGRAALLNLGAERLYPDVQTQVESALVRVLPSFVPGPAPASGSAFDWPVPQKGDEAAIRCRVVPMAASRDWWDVEQGIAGALQAVGARVLWTERLADPRLRPAPTQPDDATDLLRMDVGAGGAVTHTLLLYHDDRKAPAVHWGAGAATAWDQLATPPDAPTVALVIDDWGYYGGDAVHALLDLAAPLTFSILPGQAFSRRYALEATPLVLPATAAKATAPDGQERDRLRRAAGCPVTFALGDRDVRLPAHRREIMLHLPMQPLDYPKSDPGPGAVMVGMSAADMEAILDHDLAVLPGVRGINNHMGSAATVDAATMHTLMSVLKGRGLYFLDSLTAPASVAYDEAVRAGIPALRNRIFLDHDDPSLPVIRQRLETLVETARQRGFAVGIGHPRAATGEVLSQEIPRWQQAGVRFVTISELLALQAAAPDRAD